MRLLAAALMFITVVVACATSTGRQQLWLFNHATAPVIVVLSEEGGAPFRSVAVPGSGWGLALDAEVQSRVIVTVFDQSCSLLGATPLGGDAQHVVLLSESGEPAITNLDSDEGRVISENPRRLSEAVPVCVGPSPTQ